MSPPHRLGIVVNGENRAVPQLRGGDSQNPGAGADVQEGLILPGSPGGQQLVQTKAGGGVLSGAKAKAGVQDDHFLAWHGPVGAPARLEQEGTTDPDRLEVPLP